MKGNAERTMFLKYLDYFGVSMNLRIYGSEKYGSKTGGLTFIVFVCIILSYILYAFNAFASRKIMSIITSETVNMPSPDMNLTEMDFMGGFGMFYENCSLATDELSQYLEIKLNFNINTGTTNKTKIEK